MFAHFLLLSSLITAPVEEVRPPQVSVDLSALQDDAATAGPAARLDELLTARMKEEGFVVVPVEREHDVVVSMRPRDRGWLIRATLPSETVERTVPECGIASAEDRLEIVQKATELVRATWLRGRNVASAEEPNAAATDDATAPSDRRPAATLGQAMDPELPRLPARTVLPGPPPPPSPFEASAGLDAVLRGSHVDPMVRVAGRLALRARFGLHLIAGASRSTDNVLEVDEGQLLVGIGRRIPWNDHLRLEATAAAGALLHHYTPAAGSGNRLDPMALLVLTADFRATRHVRLQVRLAPGQSLTEYDHVYGSTPSWSRSRFRIEAGLGLVFE
jgi:hypothetical protein